MPPICIISNSLLGPGMRALLEPSFACHLLSAFPSENEEIIVEPCQGEPVTLFILDGSTFDVLAVMGQLGLPQTRFFRRVLLIVPTDIEEEVLFHLALLGVSGYLNTSTSPETFVTVVRRILNGEWLLSREALPSSPTLRLPHLADQEEAFSHQDRARPCPLTSRERELLSLIARGMSNREIAGYFLRSEMTVKSQLTVVYQKLGALDRTSAVVIALNHQWIDYPDGPLCDHDRRVLASHQANLQKRRSA